MIHIEQTTNYPLEGQALFKISGVSSYNHIKMLVYKPGCGEYYIESLTPEKNRIDITFDIPLIRAKPKGKYNITSADIYYHGNLILGTTPEENPDFSELKYIGNGRYSAGSALMSPLGDLYIKEKEEAAADKKRILFKEVI